MKLRRLGLLGATALAVLTVGGSAEAQLADVTQISPTVPGRSDQQVVRPGDRRRARKHLGARFVAVHHSRDPFRAVRRGRQIFQRKFPSLRATDQTDDGIGNPSFIGGDPSRVAGLADSCAACHGRPRGSAGFGGDVATRPDSRDSPHLFGLGLQEQLADEMTRTLRTIRAVAQSEAADTEA